MAKDDPLVERVRSARRKIATECGNDVHRIFEWAKKIEAEHRARVTGYTQPSRKS